MKSGINLQRRFLQFFILVSLLISRAFADKYLVTNTGDSGAGSLRQAMLDADAHAGPDTIVFNIPEGVAGHDADVGIWVIKPLSALPSLDSDSTVIDGTTQALFVGGDPNSKGPEIVIDGTNAGSTSGIMINSSYNIVKGIVIYNFNNSQISIYGSYNRVTGCYIGPDFSGEAAGSSTTHGIFLGVGSSYNIIGGPDHSDRNIISGNGYSGIEIRSSHYNHIEGNFIGMDRSGVDTLGNGTLGVDVGMESKHNVIGPGNIITGNANYGILFSQSGTDSNRVVGNFIGTDSSGTLVFRKQSYGIYMHDKVCHNVIGGTSPEERNVICGNTIVGVSIYGDSTDWNEIVGNYIGINSSGTDTLSNGNSGISIYNGPSHNTIGPGNVISGNRGNGIVIKYEGSDSNVVIGNIIGLDPGGTIDMGNKYNGIYIFQASYNLIGGTLPEHRNTISGNGSSGIYIYIQPLPHRIQIE